MAEKKYLDSGGLTTLVSNIKSKVETITNQLDNKKATKDELASAESRITAAEKDIDAAEVLLQSISSKLGGIDSGAEVNQNAFSNVKVGSTTVAADAKQDIVELVQGPAIVMDADAAKDKISISHDEEGPASGYTSGNTTTSISGSGGSGTIKIPQLTVDKYGHVTAAADESVTITMPTAADLGLSSALKYHGTTTTAISDGSTTNPIVIGGSNHTATQGCVVAYGKKEFVWTGSAWEELGNEGNYKVVQTAVSSPSASGSTTAFIDTISQDTNGKITVTKKNVSFPSLASYVTGPGSSTANHVAVFTDAAGKVIGDSGYTIAKSVPANAVFTDSCPTGFAWTNGTTSGPTGSLTGSGMSAVTFGAIPSASTTISGVVTTGAQTFGGSKTFTDNITILAKETDKFINFKCTDADLDSYSWRIGYLGTGFGDNNALTFQTNKTGAWVDALKFTLPGDATFSKNVTATKFITKNGTGSQFVRGDGSCAALTKENVTSALGYTPPENDTTYSAATIEKDGLLSKDIYSRMMGPSGWIINSFQNDPISITQAVDNVKLNFNLSANRIKLGDGDTDDDNTVSTGSITIPAVTKDNAGVMSTADKSYLDFLKGNVINDKSGVFYDAQINTTEESAILSFNAVGRDTDGSTMTENVDIEIPAVTKDNAGLMSAIDKSKLDSLGSMNISGTVNLTNGTFNTQNNTSLNSYTKVFGDMSVGEMRMYLVADSSGNLPSTSETAVTVPHDGVLSPAQIYFGKSAAFGVSVGDICVLFKRSSIFNVCRIIPLNDVKPANGDFPGADGLSTVWDKTRINKIDGIEWTTNHVRDTYLPKNDRFPSRADWLINVDNCIDNGVYPTCDAVGMNLGLVNNYVTLIVHRTSTTDNGGYHTIEQTAYGRGADEGQIYKRIIFVKYDDSAQYGDWKRVDNYNYSVATTEEDGLMSKTTAEAFNDYGAITYLYDTEADVTPNNNGVNVHWSMSVDRTNYLTGESNEDDAPSYVDFTIPLATDASAGVMSAKDKSKLNGMGNPVKYVSYNTSLASRNTGDANIIIINDGSWTNEEPTSNTSKSNAVVIPEPTASYEGRIITVYNRASATATKKVYLTTTTQTSDWVFDWENWYLRLAGKAKTVLICEKSSTQNRYAWIVLESA